MWDNIKGICSLLLLVPACMFLGWLMKNKHVDNLINETILEVVRDHAKR